MHAHNIYGYLIITVGDERGDQGTAKYPLIFLTFC